MNSITSVEQLVECFDDADPLEQASVLKRIDIDPEKFEEYATWESDTYTRNCIARSDDYEFILLCWDAGAKTSLHDHAGQNCWVYQVKSKVRECRYKEINTGFEKTKDLKLNEGQISYMNDQMGYHTIENPTDGRAMTLHIYVKPIDSCKVYNEDTETFEVKEMEYDTVQEVGVMV